MNKCLFLAAAACVTFSASASLRAADAPLAPAPPAPPHVMRDDLDAQLQAAQRELERAAHDVARLSTQISSSVLAQVMPFGEARVIIGVQLEPITGQSGARVREISPGGPAAEAGVHVGDVIVALNGTELRGAAPAEQVSSILQTLQPDTRVPLRVLRAGKPLELTVTPRSAPGFFAGHELPNLDFDLAQLPSVMVHRPFMDMELASLTPRLGSYFGADHGVLVVRAPSDGALQLQDGDVILAIDGREPTSGAQATRILSSYQRGEKVSLRILRDRKTLELQSTLPERAAREPHSHHEGAPGRAERVLLPAGGASVRGACNMQLCTARTSPMNYPPS